MPKNINRSETFKEIHELILSGINSWVKAGEIIAREVDESETFRDELCESCGLAPELVDRFYALGKKMIHPQLLVMEGPGPTALLKLPFALQERYCTKPIEVLIRSAKGWETLLIEVQNLTGDQARQVFANGQVRSIGAQRAFVESKNLKTFNPSAESDTPYKIVGKRVTMRRDTTFTARDLARILAEME